MLNNENLYFKKSLSLQIKCHFLQPQIQGLIINTFFFNLLILTNKGFEIFKLTIVQLL